MAKFEIKIQSEDFDFGEEYQKLKQRSLGAGAVVLFTGLVRDFNEAGELKGILLEHYPAMTEKSLSKIAEAAVSRWNLSGVTIVHRVGEILNHEQIVLVGVSAQHRAEAFEAAQFVMDYLKTEAPFWKKELTAQGKAEWVQAKETDQRARRRW